MTINYFEGLNEIETELLLKTPALVTILVAGADEKIDKKEKNWANKLVKYRTFTSDVKLHQYYEAVLARFEQDLQDLEDGWKSETSEEKISGMLSGLNTILPKIDEEYAALLKDSWKSLAEKVAEASGGLLGFGSVDENELRLIDLPMID